MASFFFFDLALSLAKTCSNLKPLAELGHQVKLVQIPDTRDRVSNLCKRSQALLGQQCQVVDDDER